MNNTKLSFIFALLMLFASCKSSQQLSQSTTSRPKSEDADVLAKKEPIKDEVFEEVDSLGKQLADTFFITQKGDTLMELDKPHDLEMFRVHKDTVSIIGVGDIMLGTNFPEKQYLPPHGGRDLLANVQHILQDADVTFGNHEGVILNEGGHPKQCNDPSVCYLFRSPEFLAQHLVEAGFDVMSLANNHAGDFGDTGRKNTMRVLDSLGIHNAGLLQRKFTTFKRAGLIFGFAAFAPNVGTVSINDYAEARAIVQHLDSISDIVIVSFHGGAEGSKYERVTRQRELFYGENRGNVYEFSRVVIDAGADVVFGHGPHVTRALDIYKDRLIAYSLGNFCTYGRFNLRGVNGIAPILKVYTHPDGRFIKGEILPTRQIGAGGTHIDADKKVIHKIIELTKLDFPESNLDIQESGIIQLKKAKESGLQGKSN